MADRRVLTEFRAAGRRGWTVEASYYPDYDESYIGLGEIGWRDIDSANDAAMRVLAACAWLRERQAEAVSSDG